MENDKKGVESRQSIRYPLSQTVTVELSASLSFQKRRQEKAEGMIQNVSDGGICFIMKRSLEKSRIVRIRLLIPNGVAAIPTLAEVRWVKKQPIHDPPAPVNPPEGRLSVVRKGTAPRREEHYLVGACFLL